MEDITTDQEEAGRRAILKQREVLCMTRSDSMSIGSFGSDLVSGGSEEMDTEDSEKDPKEGFIQSGRCRLSSQERLQKGLMLPLDNQRENDYDLERITGDVTSPVIENKLSDDVNGYYAMRTSLLSQSAVILENGGAVGKTSSGRYEDANCNIGTGNSGTRSSCEARKSSKAFHTGYSSDSESEPEGLSCSMQSTDDKHNESYSNSKQESDISSAAEVRVKIEPESDVDEPQDIKDEEHERKDFTSSVEVKTESCPGGGGDAEHAEILRKVSVDFQDGDASDSMAEIEKSGLEAKLARVSKRRIYSRARDLAQASDSSSESDSESESEEEEKEMIFEDLHSAKVLFNAAQPDSEKLIEREALKMACMDDLLSDCSSGDSSEDSSDDSSDSSSAESSDSDESSDSELSSADESDDEAEELEEKRPHKGKQTSISKDGLDKRLPEVEYLEISLPPSVELIQVGHVSSIIGSLVIIQAEPDKPALNMDTVLFKPDRSVLGQVYELFGPVVSPFYSVRFNNASDIEQHGIKLKTEAFFAPKNVDVTQYVFTEQLKKMRGSDASWKNDEECPEDVQDFSDDEAEALAKNVTKKDRKRKVPQGRNDGFQNGHMQWRHGNRQDQFHGQRSQPRSHPPLQRQAACRPPQFGPPSFVPRPHHQQHHRFMQRHSNPPGWMPPNMGPPRGDVPCPPRQWHGAPPLRPPGFPPGVPPMFQNPQTTEPPPSLQPPPQPSLQQVMQQQGFSARKMEGAASLKQSASVPSPQMVVPPPWQLKPPPPPQSWGAAPLPVRTPFMSAPSATPPQSTSTAQTNAFTNPPSNQPVPPSLGFSLFSIPPPPLTLPPPPPPGVHQKGDQAQKPPPLMDQQVHPVASPQHSAPSQMQQWIQAQYLQGQTLFTPKMGAPAAAAPVSSSNFAPPPIPPPSFHPRMMQSFRQDPKIPNSQGAPHHS